MRGEVLHYDEAQGFGFITGADGNRYTFRREDLRRDMPISKGTTVEFEPGNGQARNVFSVRAQYAASADTQPGSVPSSYGRNAVPRAAFQAVAPADTGMWGYFMRALTANYANFRDRARRKEYWSYVLFWTLAAIAISIVGVVLDSAIGNMDGSDDAPIVTGIAIVLWMLGTMVPSISIVVRRQHDIGLSGWFYLLMLIPYIGGLIIFVFTLIPSQMHENKWGPVPGGIPPPRPYNTGPSA